MPIFSGLPEGGGRYSLAAQSHSRIDRNGEIACRDTRGRLHVEKESRGHRRLCRPTRPEATRPPRIDFLLRRCETGSPGTLGSENAGRARVARSSRNVPIWSQPSRHTPCKASRPAFHRPRRCMEEGECAAALGYSGILRRFASRKVRDRSCL